MNGSSHPNHENLVNTGYWEGSPLQGLGTARRGKFGFRENRELKLPRERPRGGGTCRNGGMGASAPIISSSVSFMGNHLILIITLSGALPPPLWHPPIAIVPYYLYVIVEKFPV